MKCQHSLVTEPGDKLQEEPVVRLAGAIEEWIEKGEEASLPRSLTVALAANGVCAFDTEITLA